LKKIRRSRRGVLRSRIPSLLERRALADDHFSRFVSMAPPAPSRELT